MFVMLTGFPPFDADDLDSSMLVKQLGGGFKPVVQKGQGAWFPEEKPISPLAMDVIAG